MNIVYSARTLMSPIHRQGYPFIAFFFAASVLLGWLVWHPLFWAGLAVTIWCAYFFRDPPRIVPPAENSAVSPADGKVSYIGLTRPPRELGLPAENMLRISIFMDIFSCHVNRMPMQGRIKTITYRKGRFFNAELDKASEANEANSLLVETPHGTLGVVQIAGLVARRIVCWAEQGEECAAGQRIGLIRFGSRLDVYLPARARICVGIGQSMIAGETVLAHFSAPEDMAGMDDDAFAAGAEAADAAERVIAAEAAPGGRCPHCAGELGAGELAGAITARASGGAEAINAAGSVLQFRLD